MHRITIACLLCAVVAGGCSTGPQQPPDIIVIMVDTLRADYLGYGGFEGSISPSIDALADESLVYDACFAQSPWTKPSVASFFTSLYPQVHRLTDHEGKYWSADSPGLRTGVLSDEAVTLAEALGAAGYATAGFVSNPWVGKRYGFAQGFELYDETLTANWHRSDLLIQSAKEWIEASPDDRPLFAYLHFMDVHAPYDAPKADYAAIVGSTSFGGDRELEESVLPFRRYNNIEVRPEWADDALRASLGYWRARYASGVRAFDRRLGEFLAYLRQTGRLDRSILVFTSDHGEELFEHGGWSHGQNLYEHQLHVPLMIRLPDGRDGGSRVPDVVQLIDVMPTLLALAGAETPVRAQGRDLLGTPVPAAGMSLGTATQRTPDQHSLRTAEFKLHYNAKNGGVWLFDMAGDPGEQNDLARKRPRVADELRDRLIDLMEESVAGGTLDAALTEVPEEVRKHLEALGYLE